ncbi:MAG: TraI domain-containing protein [Legionellaceae bacterium]|nr:TraI domain-containing protein [Legionellaceae bacterium]
MFNRDEKRSKARSTKPLKDLVAVEPIEQLLDDKKRQALLLQISESIGLDSSNFNKLALPLVHNVTRYCQNLPEASLYYAHRGGLIDRTLNRTEAALQLVRRLLVLGKDDKPSEEQKLWLYALFSAGMLRGIGALHTDYSVELFDANGQQVKRWQPLLEDLSSVGKYFHYDFLRADETSFRNDVSLLLARQIMPNAGFTWIMSNPDVFAVWLALLQEDRDTTGPLAAILERADAIAIQRDITDYLVKNAEFGEGRGNRIGTFVDVAPENSVERDRVLGAEFIAWLTKSLESGKIVINKVPLHIQVLANGVIMDPQVLDIYIQEHRKVKNRVAIQNAFLASNLHRLTDAAKKSLQLGKQDSKLATAGIPLDPAILPEKFKIYNAKSGKITTMTSLDLIYNMQNHSQANPVELGSTLSHLSSTGKWVSREENSIEQRYENTQRV